MKKIFILAALVALVGSACDNGDKAKEATCTGLKLDGTIQQVPSGCTKGADLEHFRLEGLTLAKGQSAKIYYSATDNSGKNGVIVTIKDDGTISVNNNGDKTSVASKKITGTAPNLVTNKTVCFDFHNDGGILHFIAWQDKNCDKSYSGKTSNTVIDDTSAGPFKANAKKMYYQFSSGARVSLILVKEPIFKE